MRFTKMHGLGNDFVVLVPAQIGDQDWPVLARRTCDRHFGIGADGILLVLPSASADFRMRMFNPDGSEAEMCGNGIRCFGKLVLENGFWGSPELTVDTLAGLQRLRLHVQNGKVDSVEVDMGLPQAPATDQRLVIRVNGEDLALTQVSMGNPHAVVFLETPVQDYPLTTIGPLVEKDPAFPLRTNFEIVNVLSRDSIRVRVWERGAGITLACGTGACAAAVAARLRGHTDESVIVKLPGGDLRIAWPGPGKSVLMTGPAT
ncbi:MAG: diaminopimelate epimerase, partial [Chloroflexota bacterium]|nr:diaminopimelate epimerase [Chloroflexota bacterium]